MKFLPALLLALALIASASAQSDRRSFEYYRANFEKYLGKEISVQATAAERKDTGEYGDVALFLVYTGGPYDRSYAYAAVPLAETKSFSRRYATRNGGFYYEKDARPLRGKLMKGGPSASSMIVYNTGGLYISFKDAVLPEVSTELPTEVPTESGDTARGAPTPAE
jgi:hypothetical protein